MHPRESTYECDDEKLFDNNSDHSLTKKKLSNYHIFRVRSPVIVLEWGEKIIISKSVARSECERENEHMTQSCTRDLIKSFVVLRLLISLSFFSRLIHFVVKRNRWIFFINSRIWRMQLFREFRRWFVSPDDRGMDNVNIMAIKIVLMSLEWLFFLLCSQS